MRRSYPTLIALLLATQGCKPSQETNKQKAAPDASTSTSTSTSAATPPPPPAVQCVDLPPGRRFGLRSSADRKTLYYTEFTTRVNETQNHVGRYAAVALDVASLGTKTLAEDIGSNGVITKDGRIVFKKKKDGTIGGRGEGSIYSMDPGKGEAVPLTPKDKEVSNFVVDEASSSVIYDDEDFTAAQVPLAGGKPKQLGRAIRPEATLDGAVLVLESSLRLAVYSFTGQKPKYFPIAGNEYFFAVDHGVIITNHTDERGLSKRGFRAIPLGSSPPSQGADAGADGGVNDVLAFDPDSDTFFLISTGESNYISATYGDERRIFLIEGATTKKLFTTKGAWITGLVELEGGRIAVLACHDTSENGDCDGLDEQDVCFFDRPKANEVREIPTRKVPALLKSVAEKLSVLTTEPDLEGAAMKFNLRGDNGYRVVFETPKAGPADPEALRARVRAIQARVTEISGDPTFDIELNFGNGLAAESRWLQRQKRYFSFASVGSATIADPKEYRVAINGKVIHGISSATCSGTVKNIGDAPLENLEIECRPNESYGSLNALGRGAVKPAVLAPGAEGKYETKAFDYASHNTSGVQLVAKLGSDVMPYLDPDIAKRAKEIFDAALKVLAATGLAYGHHGPDYKGYFIAVLGTETFETLGTDEQGKACAKAVEGLNKATQPEAYWGKDVILRIFDRKTRKLRWTYEGGKLKVEKEHP